MTDPVTDLAMAAAKELVKAIVAGLVDLVKKIPTLWRRAGSVKEASIAAEVERSARDLEAADEADQAQARNLQEALWRARFQDLLDEHPESASDIARLLEEFAAKLPFGNTYNTQNVIAKVSGASAYGVLNADGGQGNINIHHHHAAAPPSANEPESR